MIDFRTTVLAIVVCVLAARPPLADAAYTMNETCQYMSKGFIGDPSNCASYGYCEGGVLRGTAMCKEGFLYDMEQGICNYAKSVTCRTTVSNICSNAVQAQFVGNPDDCNAYCYCNNGQASCGTCPTGQIFQRSSCGYPPDNYVCPTDSICRLVPNNVFVGNPGQCGGFVRCAEGGGTPGTCSNGGGYNPTTGYCDTTFTTCTDPGTGISTMPNAQACGKAVGGWNSVLGGTQYISDGQTCYGYYVCSSLTGPGTWGSCPFGTQLNPKINQGQCETPYTFQCPYNRCGNTDMQFVADPGCETYTVCSNQAAVLKGQSCSDVNPAFKYFNELGQGCVMDEPQYGICTGK